MGIEYIFLFICCFFIFFIILPLFLYKPKTEPSRLTTCLLNHTSNIIRGDGFVLVNNILDESCRQKLVHMYLEESRRKKRLNEDYDLDLYRDERFRKELAQFVGKSLYPAHRLDLQRCWFRYYFEGMNAQYYENLHHDIKRYHSGVKQYRLVISLYDTSDTIFTVEGYGDFAFKQNMGIFIEADNCLHKIKFTKGERFVLIMDFITEDCDSLYDHYQCRGVYGYFNWVRDSIWRNISSTYYNVVNKQS